MIYRSMAHLPIMGPKRRRVLPATAPPILSRACQVARDLGALDATVTREVIARQRAAFTRAGLSNPPTVLGRGRSEDLHRSYYGEIV